MPGVQNTVHQTEIKPVYWEEVVAPMLTYSLQWQTRVLPELCCSCDSQEALALGLFSPPSTRPFFCILQPLLIHGIVQGDQAVVGGCLLPVKGCLTFFKFRTLLFVVWGWRRPGACFCRCRLWSSSWAGGVKWFIFRMSCVEASCPWGHNALF